MTNLRANDQLARRVDVIARAAPLQLGLRNRSRLAVARTLLLPVRHRSAPAALHPRNPKEHARNALTARRVRLRVHPMWWENLPFLDALCRGGGGTMAAAARALKVDKATVSRRIAELERSAPAPLFERRNGQLELTPYGARALEAYQAHEESRRRLEASLEYTEDDTKGTVRVTMPGFFGCEVVGPALRPFLAEHTKLDVQIDCTNRLVDLARGEADVALRSIRPAGGSLHVRRVGRLAMAMFASREYLARRGGLVAPRSLAGHEYISYDTGPYTGPGFEWVADALAHTRVAFAANDALLLRAAAVSGLGLVTLPAFMGDESPALMRVPGASEGLTDIWLVTREEQRNVKRVRLVRQFLAELLRAQDARLCPAPKVRLRASHG